MDQELREAVHKRDWKRVTALARRMDSRLVEILIKKISSQANLLSKEAAALADALPYCSGTAIVAGSSRDCFQVAHFSDSKCEEHTEKHTECSGVCGCQHHLYEHRNGSSADEGVIPYSYCVSPRCRCPEFKLKSRCDVIKGEDRRTKNDVQIILDDWR